MRILLTAVNSKQISLNFELKCLYSTAASEDCLLDTKEFSVSDDEDRIFGELLLNDCDVLCFPCNVYNVETVLTISENLKKARPGLIIVLLGLEVSYDAPEIMIGNPQIDIIIEGEPEGPFLHICRAFSDKEHQHVMLEEMLAGIKGVSYRTDAGDIVQNRKIPPLIVESLTFAYNYFEAKQDSIIYYESARDCLYTCSYCLDSGNEKIRQLPIERVKQELSYFIYKKVKKVIVKDSIFNYDRRRAYDLWEYLISSDNGRTCFKFKIRTELLDEGTFSLLSKARPGLLEFEVGIQSTNRQVLNSVGRNTDIFASTDMTKRLLSLGNVIVRVNIIAGLPFDNFNSFKRTFNDMYRLNPHGIRIHLLMLLKGTDIRKHASVYGYEYKSRPPYEVISNKFISAKEIYQIKRIKNMVELYYNEGGFRETMAFMSAVFGETPFDFYNQFAEYCFKSDLSRKLGEKEALCRMCYAFAQTKEDDMPGSLAKIKQFLAKDAGRSFDFDEAKGLKS